jgi:hypothetical protein
VIARDLRSDTDHAELLEALFAEQGIGRHGLFMTTGEGRVTPDGYEEMSGYVVSESGCAFFFWTGWNEHTGRSAFKVWRPAEPQPDWQDDDEYQAARQAAGLA